MNNFLLEIGTEELPADFSNSVLKSLSLRVKTDLDDQRIDHGEIACFSTPRRIVISIESLSGNARDFVQERKGPRSAQAFQNGEPTKAALGFAKSCGVEVGDLEIKTTSKGDFLFYPLTTRGKSAEELLASLVPDWISSIQGRRFMRWGNGRRKFSRPIRWIVCLLNDVLIPIQITDCQPQIRSGNESKGHRLYQPNIKVDSASTYFETLEKAGVQVNRENRKIFIKNLILQTSSNLKAIPELDEVLLDELTDLVEAPFLIKGNFDKSFLELPPEVLTNVMKKHQRYVPLSFEEKSQKDPLILDSRNSLLPSFLCISNGLENSKEIIQIGNERVLKARLSDACFFIKADTEVSSESRNEKLKQVAFTDGLGSLYDRVKRIEWITSLLLKKISGPKLDEKHSLRAAFFCKHDLVSQIVGEFPELQGVMGAKYLLLQGEDRAVAEGVAEQYMPRGSSDSIPQTDTGALIALAERFELLLSIFAKGERPSGSSDPYALRRAGNGIFQILLTLKWKVDLNQFLKEAIEYWHHILPKLNIKPDFLLQEFSVFFRLRIISYLEDKGIEMDLIQSVAGKNIPVQKLLADPADIILRIDLLSDMRKKGELSKLNFVVNRASKLAEKSTLSEDEMYSERSIDESLLQNKCEINLFNLIKLLEPICIDESASRYEKLAKLLVSSTEYLAEFFDGENSVMVMSNNLDLRNNRLNLLRLISNYALLLADFSELNNKSKQ